MRNTLLILSFFFSIYINAQYRGVVTNSISKDKIPFVNIWIEGEAIGTTSNFKGEFIIENTPKKPLVFSAIGYRTKSVSYDSINSIVELIPIAIELDEVEVTLKREILKQKVGKLSFIGTNKYFGCSETKPWIVARFFSYDQSYRSTPFLSKIRLVTKSALSNAIFNLRLYTVNESGQPGEYILGDNIIGVAPKGKEITEIDISKYNIAFPESGFFIAVEWLVVEPNKFQFKGKMSDSRSKEDWNSIEPMVGTIASETDENSWIMIGGKWVKIWKMIDISQNKAKYELLAVELLLTN